MLCSLNSWLEGLNPRPAAPDGSAPGEPAGRRPGRAGRYRQFPVFGGDFVEAPGILRHLQVFGGMSAIVGGTLLACAGTDAAAGFVL
jgi:hypothetical protein